MSSAVRSNPNPLTRAWRPIRRALAASFGQWRTVDIVVAAVVAAVFGVLYWAWGFVPTASLFAFFPPLAGVLSAVFLMAGPVGALIVRRPGAALFTEFAAALFESMVSVHWSGTSIIVYGLVQGLGAELAFLLVRYRSWSLPVAALSGALTGLVSVALDLYIYRLFPTFGAGWQLSYLLAGAIGGLVLAGVLAWTIVRALASTGVLAPFASGREQRLV